jgi:iron complex outermembrane recepter protein
MDVRIYPTRCRQNMHALVSSKCPAHFALVAAISGLANFAQQPNSADLSQASLEDLMNIQVASVSKKEQKLSKVGAAICVITQEGIRRSGATNIRDLLRLAADVDAAQIDANRWAISIRAMNDQHTNKVLMLIDGRSVYSPSLSGVFWDMVDVPLENIDSGRGNPWPGRPGGANAGKGVINIMTKSAAASPGGLVSGGAGSEDRAEGLLQYGGEVGQEVSYRIFARYFGIEKAAFLSGVETADEWMAGHAGFRSDWNLSPRDTLTVQRDSLKTDESRTITTLFSNDLPLMQTFNDPLTMTVANMPMLESHSRERIPNIAARVRQLLATTGSRVRGSQSAMDIDFQHHVGARSRNDVVWRVGARVIDSNYVDAYQLTVFPNGRPDRLFSAFPPDELKLTHSLSVTIGSKVEHNDFTGFEFEPSAQLAWAPPEKQILWASEALAIREPSPSDVGVDDNIATVPIGVTFAIVRAIGNPSINAEELRDQGVHCLVLHELVVNGPGARTYGGKFFAHWNLIDRRRISPGYSFFHIHIDGDSQTLVTPAGISPNPQFQVCSLLDLPHRLERDNTHGYFGKLVVGNIPLYGQVDSRLDWRAGECVELSLVRQNLVTPRHVEFSDGNYTTNHTLAERSVFLKVTWRFDLRK